MPTFLQDNRMLAWILAGVAFLIAFVLILKIVEIAVDLRRRIPRGSRARQLRLGFVETFDLDGERQLLLVRRDNVEHLLLIGGPNDVLVESGIVRVEPREGARNAQRPWRRDVDRRRAAAAAALHSRAGRGRASARDSGAAALLHSGARARAGVSVSVSIDHSRRAGGNVRARAPTRSCSGLRAAAPPPVERPAPRFPLPPRVGGVRPAGPLPPSRFPAPSSAPGAGDAPPRPRFVMPPIARRATPVAPPPPPPPAEAPEPPHTPEPASTPVEDHAPNAEPQAQPSFVAPKPPVFAPPEANEPPPAPEPAPPAPSEPAKPELTFDGEFEPLESLEEEMAKLLGRPLKK